MTMFTAHLLDNCKYTIYQNSSCN